MIGGFQGEIKSGDIHRPEVMEHVESREKLPVPDFSELKSRLEDIFQKEIPDHASMEKNRQEANPLEGSDLQVVTLDDGTVVVLPDVRKPDDIIQKYEQGVKTDCNAKQQTLVEQHSEDRDHSDPDDTNKAATNDVDITDRDTDETSEEQNETDEDDIKPSLTEEEKARIKEETGWSDEIIDAIESMDQYEIYKNADLHEAEVNGRKCLLKDIDLDYIDPKTGKTNKELMAEGKSPIDSKTGEKIELHHMGQNFDGPFAELTENSEHGDGKHKILHTSHEGSWRNDSEMKNQYQREKAQHWKTRAQGEM